MHPQNNLTRSDSAFATPAGGMGNERWIRRTMKRILTILAVLWLAPLTLLHAADGARDAASGSTPSSQAQGQTMMVPVPYGRVAVRGEIGRRMELTIAENLLKLDLEGVFLRPLDERNGHYKGIGILLNVACRLAAATGDERVKAVRDRIAQKLIAAQEKDGYIGYKQPAYRVWTLFDPDEMAQIILGLVAHHRLTDDAKSLAAARKLGDYVVREMRARPEKTKEGMADVLQWICIDQAIVTLSEQTGERDYLDFCVRDRRLAEWPGPIVLGRHGRLEGHAYGHLTKCVAQLQLYRQTHDERLLGPSRRLLDFLMHRDGMVISGAVSEQECWHDTQEGLCWLGETCATTFLVEVLDELLRADRNSVHGDVMERMIYNTLFAAQSPDGRQIRYYTAFEGDRSYFKGDAYCCPNNYRRAIAFLPQYLYYRDGDGITVNLYTESTAEMALSDGLTVKLRQETDYPTNGKVLLHVEPSREAWFPLRLRIPSWCEAAKITVNGTPVSGPVAAGRFFAIERDWKTGDRVELNLPMVWRWVKGRKAQVGRAALMRGPLLFCLNPSRNKGLEGADLRRLIIDGKTLKEPVTDNSIRTNGIKAVLSGKLLSVSDYLPVQPNLTLELTEFTDGGKPANPTGWAIEERDGPQAIYFRVSNAGLQDDELLDGKNALPSR